MEKFAIIIKDLAGAFTRITTAVVIVTALYIRIFWNNEVTLDEQILWQILAVSFLTSLGNLLFYIKKQEELSKQGLFVRLILDFLYVNGIVLGCGIRFGWFDPANHGMLLGMVLCILAVYWGIVLYGFRRQKKMAFELNERLRQRKGDVR